MSGRWAAGASLAAVVLWGLPAAVSADSLTPVRMTVKLPAVARLDRPLPIKVTVSADPGVLDVRQGTLRAQVKLGTAECGSTFATSPGAVVLDAALRPQPSPGRAYTGAASGHRLASAYGVQSACAYLDDDYEQFATQTTDLQINVSRACTVTADRYDVALRALTRAERRSRLAHSSAPFSHWEKLLSRRRTTLARARRAARSACGPGVTL